MSSEHQNDAIPGSESPHFSTAGDEDGLPAWTEIDTGRFMPRRVRGSYHGRALGWVFTVSSSGPDDAQNGETTCSDHGCGEHPHGPTDS